MLRVLEGVGAEIYGIREPDRASQRIPTFSFNLRNIPPAAVAQELARNHFGVRAGHMYSPRLMGTSWARPGNRRRTGLPRTLQHNRRSSPVQESSAMHECIARGLNKIVPYRHQDYITQNHSSGSHALQPRKLQGREFVLFLFFFFF